MSKTVGKNNSKIITRNQGGGDKKQGLAPLATQFFISQANNVQYRTESGDGRNRDLVICVNQLGGVGKGRSQFRSNADGKRGPGCENDFETFKTYLYEINHYIQQIALVNAFKANNITVGLSNEIFNYQLCLVGNSESLVSDICANGISNEYITISNEGFGVGGARLFTHLLSEPHQQQSSIHAVIKDPLKISYWNNNSNNWNSDISINVQAVQYKITWCNNYIKSYSSTSYLFTIQDILSKFGYHTLGLINNNVTFDDKNATKFLQSLSYGINSVFNIRTITPITGNDIHIFSFSVLSPTKSVSSANYSVINIENNIYQFSGRSSGMYSGSNSLGLNANFLAVEITLMGTFFGTYNVKVYGNQFTSTPPFPVNEWNNNISYTAYFYTINAFIS